LGDALVRAGFSSPVLDVERFTLQYLDVRKLAEDLKATGGRNATAGRARGLTSPRKFAAMRSAYESFRQEGRLPATYEVVFAHAWVPVQSARRPSNDSASVSLEDIKQELRARRSKV
jgi:malonyl-CoA O-methyltransferase